MAALHPRPAATLILLRPASGGIETLMIQRTHSAAFLGGAYVFPGGALDAADGATQRVLGLDDAQASARLGIATGGLAYYVAAVRECFEEAGVLLACDVEGRPVSAERAQALMPWRARAFGELLETEDLYIPGGALAYYGHWITAPGRTRRFDTRFFLAVAPEGQQGAHDAAETLRHVWIAPREALERGARKEIELVHATERTLMALAGFSEPRAAFEHAMALGEVPENRACWALGKEGARLYRRGDPQYFEIHWSDPEETGQTSAEIVPGVAKRLDRYVVRLTAPNPGAMTGPGTNSYAIGEGELAVIDPGPAIASHIDGLLAMGPIRWILCTHTHRDHSPGAALLKAATGAPVYGRPAPAGQDESFAPDMVLEDGAHVQLGPLSLRVLHTPGHASNHLCYLLEQTKMLFTGDHVMQGSTVVINPPDGDMRAYLASLERLLAEDIAIIAPGHGYLIGEPHREVRRLIAHRRKREEKVLAALRRLGEPTLEEMLPLVYDDVPVRMHGWAARSLTAHLDKLLDDGAVRATAGRYRLA